MGIKRGLTVNCVHAHLCVQTSVCPCVQMCGGTCMCICVLIYVCVCLSLCVYPGVHTSKAHIWLRVNNGELIAE